MMEPLNGHNGFFHGLKKKSGDFFNNYREMGLRGLLKNFVSLSFLQAVNYLIPLITLPYLSAVLGIDKFGLVFFAQATMQYFIIITDFGFYLSATREISEFREDKIRVSKIFSSVLTVKLFLMLFSFILLFSLVQIVPRFHADSTIFLLTFGLVIGNGLFPVWFFQGIEKMNIFTILTVSARLIFLALIFIFVRNPEDYLLVPVFNSTGLIIASVFGLYIAVSRYKAKFIRPTLNELYDRVKGSFYYFTSVLSSTVCASFNTMILGLYSTNEMVGYYTAAEKLFIAMRSGFSPFVQGLYPYMANRKNVVLYRKIFYGVMSFAIIASAGVYIFSKEIIELLYQPDYLISIDILRLFAILVPVSAASLLIGYPLLAASGEENYANHSNTIGSIIHVIIILCLLPGITPYNVAIHPDVYGYVYSSFKNLRCLEEKTVAPGDIRLIEDFEYLPE